MTLAYIASVKTIMEHIDLSHVIENSTNLDGDIYNEYGLNVSAHRRRQDFIPWKSVYYSKKQSDKKIKRN